MSEIPKAFKRYRVSLPKGAILFGLKWKKKREFKFSYKEILEQEGNLNNGGKSYWGL